MGPLSDFSINPCFQFSKVYIKNNSVVSTNIGLLVELSNKHVKHMLKYTQKENVLLVLYLAPNQMLHGNTVYKHVCLLLITDINNIYIKFPSKNGDTVTVGVKNTTALNLPLPHRKQILAKKYSKN